jgi:hypothetical protein
MSDSTVTTGLLPIIRRVRRPLLPPEEARPGVGTQDGPKTIEPAPEKATSANEAKTADSSAQQKTE